MVRVFEASDEFISNHLRSCREGRTRHTPHATRHTPHAMPAPASPLRFGCPDPAARFSPPLFAGAWPEELSRCETRRSEAVRHAQQLPPPTHSHAHTPPHTHTTAHALPHTDARSAVRKCVHDGRLTSGPATYADSDAITQLSEPTAPAHTPHLVWPNPNPPHTAPAPARTQLTAHSAHSARSPAPPRPAPSVASGNRPRHSCGRRCYLARRCGASRIILSCRHTLGAFSLESGRT